MGLVGFPNAGKSTLLSIVTKARPKIANYPFTTLEPHLGVLTSPDNTKELVVADIPGLIEGASEGKGLGFDFLRHIENTRTLLYVLSLDENVVFDDTQTDADKAELVWDQYQKLKKELGAHTQELLAKESLVAVNKVDLYPESLQLAITKLFAKHKTKCYLFSGVTSIGLDELKKEIFQKASR